MDVNPGTPRTDDGPLRLARPVHRLSPDSADLHHDAVIMREAGPVVPVELPGGVPVWAVTRDAVARQVLRAPDVFSSDRRHWRALHGGEIPADWPLLGLAAPQGRSLVNVDNPDHSYLRGPLATVFTEKRVRGLQPLIEDVTDRLLDRMAAAAHATADNTVDFRQQVAWPLPMTVISHLLGVPECDHSMLREHFDVLFDDTQDPKSAMADLIAYLHRHLQRMRRAPGTDLTSDLLRLSDGKRLTDDELVAALQVLIVAGHETTVHLLVNAVRTLTTHRDQLDLLLSGDVAWSRAVEEVLRWDPPTANFLLRFATRPATLAGADLQAGDPVMISYIAMGRDPERYGPAAGEFDVRNVRGHTSFGHGAHVCLGAPLARLEGRIVLERLFGRWPALTVASAPDRFPTVLMNSYSGLTVRLAPADDRPCDIPAGV
ncbi:cytochrome P450 [Streptomyces sp. WAC 06783]|uniref:cytochrome P450 n=1 Tax=Streptomyces sp. WAC 06783 TaxID=2203211 RepID=UPI000F741C15|nr:cytochrome P450 [Streptomyces sp. WAC 06783]RSO07030.1 cytochrome P450 [Streptomyces sp. WAC 06783]